MKAPLQPLKKQGVGQREKNIPLPDTLLLYISVVQYIHVSRWSKLVYMICIRLLFLFSF